MTEQEAIKEVKRWTNILMSAGSKCVSDTAETQEMAINALEEVQKYRAIGTVEKIREELDRLRNDNECQGLYFTLEERQDLARQHRELEEYRAIGTPEECRAAVDKQKDDKELESHDEKHILKSCLGLMQEMVNDFAEWYRWQHGEDSIEELDEEEIFCVRKTYFLIVQKLLLLHTNHSGGTSTRAKCEQLGVDWGEEISFDWSDEE